MEKTDIRVEKISPRSDIIMIKISGPLDTVASYSFQEKIKKLIEYGVFKYVINLEKLDYISSAGIGVFPGVALELQKNKGGIVFIHVSEKVYKLFNLIGLTTIFKVKDSLDEAIKAFEPDG